MRLIRPPPPFDISWEPCLNIILSEPYLIWNSIITRGFHTMTVVIQNQNIIFLLKINPSLECGCTLGWTASANNTTIGLGAKVRIYSFD